MCLTPKWIATTRLLWSWEKAVKEKDQKNEWMLKYNYLTEKKIFAGSQWLLEWLIGNAFFVKSSLVGQGSSSCIAEMFFVLLSNECSADVRCYVFLWYKKSQTTF